MRMGDDPAVMPEPEPDRDNDTCDSESVHDAIRRVVAEILYHDNARLTTECIALISGLAYTGSSISKVITDEIESAIDDPNQAKLPL